MGISGGGWYTVWLSALIPEIKFSLSYAGSLPIEYRKFEGISGDWEQQNSQIYNYVSYWELYKLMTIEEKIFFYKNNLDCFEEVMDKYRFLLDQGKKAEIFPEEYRQESFKVEGCQAQVWLVPEFKNNLLSFYSDSNAFISKGMVTILTDIYGKNNEEPPYIGVPKRYHRRHYEMLTFFSFHHHDNHRLRLCGGAGARQTDASPGRQWSRLLLQPLPRGDEPDRRGPDR